MQTAWNQVLEAKQPVLSIIRVPAEVTERKQVEEDVMPWHEETTQGGYDGDLTKMTFNHVVHSDQFKTKSLLGQQGAMGKLNLTDDRLAKGK